MTADPARSRGHWLGALAGVAAALPVIAIALLLVGLWSAGNVSRNAGRRADLEVGADLRAIGDALQASFPRRALTDDGVRRLVRDAAALPPDRVVAVRRPAAGIAVTVRLERREASLFGGASTTAVCAEIALGALGRQQSGPRPCRPEELAPPMARSAATR